MNVANLPVNDPQVVQSAAQLILPVLQKGAAQVLCQCLPGPDAPPEAVKRARRYAQTVYDHMVLRVWHAHAETRFYTIYLRSKSVHYRGSYLGIAGLRQHFIEREILPRLDTAEIEPARAHLEMVLPESTELRPGFTKTVVIPAQDPRHHATYLVVEERITRVLGHLLPQAE